MTLSVVDAFGNCPGLFNLLIPCTCCISLVSQKPSSIRIIMAGDGRFGWSLV